MHIYAARPLSTDDYWGLLIRHLDSQSWRRLKRCRNERQPLTPFRKRIVYIDRMFTSKIVLTTGGVITQAVICKDTVVCMGADIVRGAILLPAAGLCLSLLYLPSLLPSEVRLFAYQGRQESWHEEFVAQCYRRITTSSISRRSRFSVCCRWGECARRPLCVTAEC